MNIVVLKQWLKDYLESGDGKSWRESYQSTFDKVQIIRKKLESGHKLSFEKDRAFLNELLKDSTNGIASKGQSNIANDIFEQIIKDAEFLNVVEKLILDPTEHSYSALNIYGSQLLNQFGSTKRPLLFNRACASCTLDVSTIVDRKKFNEFINYINEQNIIEFPPEIREKNWYQQNIYLVKKIREAFKEELESHTTDIFWLNMFLWDIYAEKVATGFNAKRAVSYLQDRYPNTYSGTVHIATFKTPLGREFALDPKSKTPVIICDAQPPEELKLSIKKEYLETDTRHHHLSTHAKSLDIGNRVFSILISNLDELEKFCDWYENNLHNDQANTLENSKNGKKIMEKALNRILFGAAGTGKTYHTISHALSIIDTQELSALEKIDREKLKNRFDQLKKEGRIKFVTFHQSFSYEDFVEGIRAETNDIGQLTYDVKSGVFKELCEDAEAEIESKQIDELAPTEISIHRAIDNLINRAKTEEIIFHTKRGVEFRVSSNTSGTLFALTSTGSNVSLSIRYIRNYLKTKSNTIISKTSYEWAIANTLHSKLEYETVVEKPKPYILIIDEINRGNISRIFGELITLIEDSKREGAEEALSVTLSYSKEEFSVPENVYIIGTMNSSDRSLTGLDIALRRRFTFIEMPPKPELLNGVIVEGLDIEELLKVINQRIEVLLDRDHCIGHANFMSLKEQATRDNLAHIFKHKIIPQLQEYFFDDWGKINLVLFQNDMITEDKEINISSLFPADAQLDTDYSERKKVWRINDDAFKTIDAFKKILG
ncbi:AAA family ATPase [Acinetobacter sp. NyZ410]|uniref:McrB family protein n=1 Tax=Acinetobacter sp. NyZ410 TaxID=2929509 RepID=UPI001FB9FC4F|nr:AAA family ATPase [Acinetobacter sp. NyZ410]UOH17795.1 AAA family ATPase [Acinetobacter sp. NyZ410]